MRAFDVAWSVLKADPRMQAYEQVPYMNMHPDLEDYHTEPEERGSYVHNLGTIDPNVLAMLIRQKSGMRPGEHPQEKMSRMLRHPTMGRGGIGSFYDAQSPVNLLSTPASDHYTNPGEGFTGREISRAPRPKVPRHMTSPPFNSPQAAINWAIRRGDDTSDEAIRRLVEGKL